jgi:hypothetical protein
MDLNERRNLIRAELIRAREALPAEIPSETIRLFQEFLDHNELGLASDTLEDCGEEYGATREFWVYLMRAAEVMELSNNARRYKMRAENSSD